MSKSVSKTLNAKRLLCPMPVIRTQQAIKHLRNGDVLAVICTDPGTMSDIPAWCRMYGHELLHAEQRQNEAAETEYHFQIKVCQQTETEITPQQW